MVFQPFCRVVALDTHLNICALEAMRPGVLRMKHEMHRNEEDIFQCSLVQRAGVGEIAMLQTIDVCRDVCVSRQSSLVQTLLVDLEALLWGVDVSARGAGRVSSLSRSHRQLCCSSLRFRIAFSKLMQQGTHRKGCLPSTAERRASCVQEEVDVSLRKFCTSSLQLRSVCIDGLPELVHSRCRCDRRQCGHHGRMCGEGREDTEVAISKFRSMR